MRAAARTTTDAQLAERAIAFDAGVFERAAEVLRRVDGATPIAHPSLPLVPFLSKLVVHDPSLGADVVEALADELLGEFAHRYVLVEHDRLGGELVARGWRADPPLLLLGRDGALAPPDAPAFAEEVPYGHVRALRDEWLRAEPWSRSDAMIAQVHEGDRRLFAATSTRAFAAFEHGRPLAYALLVSDGRDGMLEDVYTTPGARGRGLSTSVIAAVLHASRAAGHEAVFVPTDADGQARTLYERLGFEPLTVLHRYAKDVR